MVFGGMQRFSTLDFPGVLSCVLFVRGCDLDCFYCHNRALLGNEGPRFSQTEALDFLEKRRGLLDGVVVSGGEPTLHDDLPAFLAIVRGMGFRTKLDTNGQRPDQVLSLWRAGLLDYAAVDLKAPEADYPSVCGGAGFPKARAALLGLLSAGARFEARTTLYPGLSLEGLRDLLAQLPALPAWRLNFFRMPVAFRLADEARLKAPALAPQAVLEAEETLRALQPGLVFSA